MQGASFIGTNKLNSYLLQPGFCVRFPFSTIAADGIG